MVRHSATSARLSLGYLMLATGFILLLQPHYSSACCCIIDCYDDWDIDWDGYPCESWYQSPCHYVPLDTYWYTYVDITITQVVIIDGPGYREPPSYPVYPNHPVCPECPKVPECPECPKDPVEPAPENPEPQPNPPDEPAVTSQAPNPSSEFTAPPTGYEVEGTTPSYSSVEGKMHEALLNMNTYARLGAIKKDGSQDELALQVAADLKVFQAALVTCNTTRKEEDCKHTTQTAKTFYRSSTLLKGRNNSNILSMVVLAGGAALIVGLAVVGFYLVAKGRRASKLGVKSGAKPGKDQPLKKGGKKGGSYTGPPTTGTGSKPSAGSKPPTTGSKPPTTGSKPPSTGTKPPSTGTKPPSTDVKRPRKA